MIDFSGFFRETSPNTIEFAANRLSRKRYVVSEVEKNRLINFMNSLHKYGRAISFIATPIIIYDLKIGLALYYISAIFANLLCQFKFRSIKKNYRVIYLDKREPFLLFYKKQAIKDEWEAIQAEGMKSLCFLLVTYYFISNYLDVPSISNLSFSIISLIFSIWCNFIITMKIYYKRQYLKINTED